MRGWSFVTLSPAHSDAHPRVQSQEQVTNQRASRSAELLPARRWGDGRLFVDQRL